MEVQKIPEMRTSFNYHTMNHVVLLCVVSNSRYLVEEHIVQ